MTERKSQAKKGSSKPKAESPPAEQPAAQPPDQFIIDGGDGADAPARVFYGQVTPSPVEYRSPGEYMVEVPGNQAVWLDCPRCGGTGGPPTEEFKAAENWLRTERRYQRLAEQHDGDHEAAHAAFVQQWLDAAKAWEESDPADRDPSVVAGVDTCRRCGGDGRVFEGMM